MNTEPHELRVREFLTAYPEHIPGVRYADVDGKPELVMDTETVIAFVEWCIRTGQGDSEKAKELLADMRERFKDHH